MSVTCCPARRTAEQVFEGLAVSPGVAIGPAYIRESGNIQVPEYEISESQVPVELGIPPQVYDAHAAATKLAFDGIGTDLFRIRVHDWQALYHARLWSPSWCDLAETPGYPG